MSGSAEKTTCDFFGKRWRYVQKIFDLSRKVARSYGFQRIETPLLEKIETFEKAGINKNFLKQETLILKDRGKELVLRPEATVGIIRASTENDIRGWQGSSKFWYFGPFFQKKASNKNDCHQVWRFGVEFLGGESSVVDAHTIQFFYVLLKELGFARLRIKINSTGCSRCRARYRKELEGFLSRNKSNLCKDCQKRIQSDIFSVFECDKKKCQKTISGAPQVLDSLWKRCRIHFREVLEFLDDIGLPYELNPYLFCGSNYCDQTVFRIVPEGKDIPLAQGGRHDALLKGLGESEKAGFGGVLLIENLIMMMKRAKTELPKEEKPRVFLAQLGITAKREALCLFEELRKKGIFVAKDFACDSLSRQLRKAKKIGVDLTIILAKKEMIEGKVIFRDMENDCGEEVQLSNVVKEIKKRLK